MVPGILLALVFLLFFGLVVLVVLVVLDHNRHGPLA